jgi:rubredoxin
MMPEVDQFWTVGKKCEVCGDTIFTDGKLEWCTEDCKNDGKKVVM